MIGFLKMARSLRGARLAWKVFNYMIRNQWNERWQMYFREKRLRRKIYVVRAKLALRLLCQNEPELKSSLKLIYRGKNGKRSSKK